MSPWKSRWSRVRLVNTADVERGARHPAHGQGVRGDLHRHRRGAVVAHLAQECGRGRRPRAWCARRRKRCRPEAVAQRADEARAGCPAASRSAAIRVATVDLPFVPVTAGEDQLAVGMAIDPGGEGAEQRARIGRDEPGDGDTPAGAPGSGPTTATAPRRHRRGGEGAAVEALAAAGPRTGRPGATARESCATPRDLRIVRRPVARPAGPGGRAISSERRMQGGLPPERGVGGALSVLMAGLRAWRGRRLGAGADSQAAASAAAAPRYHRRPSARGNGRPAPSWPALAREPRHHLRPARRKRRALAGGRRR